MSKPKLMTLTNIINDDNVKETYKDKIISMGCDPDKTHAIVNEFVSMISTEYKDSVEMTIDNSSVTVILIDETLTVADDILSSFSDICRNVIGNLHDVVMRYSFKVSVDTDVYGRTIIKISQNNF